MNSNVENQIMANAPSPIRKSYFDNFYCFIAAEAKTRAVESENHKKVPDLKMRELELKEWSVQLRESLLNATSVPQLEEEEKVINEVDCCESPIHDNSQSFLDHNQVGIWLGSRPASPM